MSSLFAKQALRVRNEALPETTRLLGFVSAVNQFAYRTNQSAAGVLYRLGPRVGLDVEDRPTVRQALGVLSVLEEEMRLFGAEYAVFSERRLAEKRQGRRQLARADHYRWNDRSGYVPISNELRRKWGLPSGPEWPRKWPPLPTWWS